MAVDVPDINKGLYEKIQVWSLVSGIGMILLGLLTSTFAAFTTYFTMMFLGIVIAVRGVTDIFAAFMPHRKKGVLWHLFGGILSLVIGVLVVFNPGVTAAVLTFLVAAFLIILGLFKVIASPIEQEANWGWMMFSGIVSVGFGIWIIGVWPEASFRLIGIFVGLEIFIQGIVMIFLPTVMLRARKGGREMLAQ
ncbi:MAG TPA: DUF308 domain-containing protein [Chitinispirillaceae bacterium]|nr:DUF308 domain-containing protein [Chitinispirillaceae bacterium]